MTPDHIIAFFKSVVIPQLEYACPAWSTSIRKEQSSDIERIQKRALKRLIWQRQKANLIELDVRRNKICKTFFQNMQHKDNILNDLLPAMSNSNYKLRASLNYRLPKVKTQRFKNSFVPHCLFNFQ